ncbi:PAS domain S-box protein [Massilia litorea]|uniref:Sensory/regulatory protein RpfC n=1 Tax=Massilia litorea TaxID=2769491 RepID=A0A7L9U203_9BURK|nr:PAS domain S-box protein [Massilia litorea]QOL49063.1 PAS domain S-box protein [Massilia litorea]
MRKLRPHQAAGILVSLLGLVVMAGWWTGQTRLVHLTPNYFPMLFNVALSFFVAGGALVLPESRPGLRERGQQAAGLLVAALAATIGLQDVLGTDFGIDQLFVTQWFDDGNPHPGRMAPLTSAGFILTGACLMLMQRLRSSRAAQLALQVLVHGILAAGIFSLVGYSLKLELLYNWYRFARMAPHTAIGFILLGAGLWALWFRTLKLNGVYADREDKRIAAFATLILFVLAFTGGLAGFVLSIQRTEASLKQNLEAALANRTQLLEIVLDDRVKLARALASDPSLLASLQEIAAHPARDRAAALAKMDLHVMGDMDAGMAVLAADGAAILQRGHLVREARLALPLRQGATLLWDEHAIMQVDVPVIYKGKRFGTLVLQNAMPAIDKLLADASLLGKTGDIIMCAALSAGQMRCLPTRLVLSGYPVIDRVTKGQPWPASRALDGQAGVVTLADGRGQQVIAAHGPVRGFGLGVVVKQDTAELFAQIRAQMTDLLVLLTLLVAASLLLLRWQLVPLVTSLLAAKRKADINEARIRSVVDNVADGLITIDEQGRIESINPAAAAMFGYELDEAAGCHFEMLIPARFRRNHARIMADYARTGTASIIGGAAIDVHGQRKDGSEFPMQIAIREMRVEGQRLFVGIVRDISRRRHAEQEMRKAEERFRLVSQATNDVVWDLDFATEQTWWNEGLIHQFGYRPEEVESGPAWWRDRVHPEDREALLAVVDRELASGCRFWAQDYRFARADGSYMHIHDRAYIIRDEDGNPTRAIGAMMDVTQRKEAEARLRQSESRFSEVFNLSPVAITVTRVADGGFLDVNDALLQMLGYERHEVIGHTSLSIDFWLSPEERAAMVARIQARGSVRDFPMRARAKGGRVLDLLISVNLVELEGEAHLFCFLTNVTERKRAEEALRESEEKFRSIVETTMDWIWSIDAQGRVLYANPAVTDILGFQPEELIGTTIVDCLHPDAQREVATELSRLAAGKGTWTNLVLRWRHKDGSDRYTQSSAVPMLSEDGKLLGYRGSDHDITLLKRYEQELEDAKHKAEAANQAKSEFLANMSHEIRTPMNGVIGLTSLVLNTQLSAQQREYLGLMKSSADSLLRLLNDILDFSKMEARKLELDAVEFDVREAVGNTLKTFSASASEKGLELAYHVAPDVPALLVGDPGRLAQIIVNLAGNALKFTRQGEVVVRVAGEPQGDAGTLLHISVADSGIGMSPEQQAHIFAAFAQADSSTTRQYGGTGLGLTIVSQLVALMDGTIRVESEPGKGTTFHLAVRLGLPEHQPAPGIGQQAPALKNMPVLVVDDNRSNRLILAEILVSWGMQPVLAADGRQALAEMREQAARGTPFPLVLLDAGMPQFDGFELAKAIKASPVLAGGTVMMLSSSDASAEIARCNALGVTRFVRKPVKQSELFDAIASAASAAPAGRGGAPEHPLPLRAVPARKLNVLVAEDHHINQVLIAAILSGLGHSFSIARNGLEVLQLLEHEPPGQPFDVVLMDGQMPEMDGYQATAEIRRREQLSGRHLHIIAVTANAMKDDREVCLAAGMDDYLTKPIDTDQLIERLEATQRRPGKPGPEALPAPSAPTGAPTAFDLESALKRTRGKLTLLKQLAALFLQDLPDSLAELQLAIAAGDMRAIERLAHRLRGAAFTVSAEPLAEAANRLEQIGKNREPGRVQEAVRDLQARAAELTTELAQLTEKDL